MIREYIVNIDDTLKGAQDDIDELERKYGAEERLAGHWLGIQFDGYADGNPVYDIWECSECRAEFSGEDFDFEYCPRCGSHNSFLPEWTEDEDG